MAEVPAVEISVVADAEEVDEAVEEKAPIETTKDRNLSKIRVAVDNKTMTILKIIREIRGRTIKMIGVRKLLLLNTKLKVTVVLSKLYRSLRIKTELQT